MRTLAMFLVLVAVPGALYAQPGQTPPSPQQPYAPPAQQPYAPPAQQPYGPPQPYAPPPQSYPPPQQPYGAPPQPYAPPPYPYPPVPLTPDEQALLADGEISDGAYIGGAVTGLFFGFGVGQAVQGRYGDTGWIFTLGEAGSLAAIIGGAVDLSDCVDFAGGPECSSRNEAGALLAVGVTGLVVFRVWEIVDAFAGPPRHNRRVRELRTRLGLAPPVYGQRVIPYVRKAHDGTASAGLTFRF